MRRRGIRMYLLLVVAAAAVVVSWMAPESPAPAREPVVEVSSAVCGTDYSGPPSYGTRALARGCAR